jgi:antitoxin MazE
MVSICKNTDLKKEEYSLTVVYMNFNFKNRKVQKVKYSYLIPLPPEWVNSMGVSKGDSIKIEMQDDQSLRITPVPTCCQDEGAKVSSTVF